MINWLRNLKTSQLVKIAAIGSLATVSMGLMTRSKISSNVKQTEYYKEALTCLRKHRGAVSVLGEPIKDFTINVGDQTNNYTKETTAKYEVPVSGPKHRGTLHFWADKVQDKWSVTRIELELKNDPYKRLLIKQTDNT